MTDTPNYPPEDVARWTAAIRLIMERDGVTEEEANAGLQWAIQDAIDKGGPSPDPIEPNPPADPPEDVPQVVVQAITKIEDVLTELKTALGLE